MRGKKLRWTLLIVCLLVTIPLALAFKWRKRPHRHAPAALSAAVSNPARRTEAPAADSTTYLEQIKPLLKARCVGCHGGKRQEGGLRLDSLAGMLKGGHNGPVLLAGAAERSLLWQRVTDKDEEQRMPPSGSPLDGAEVGLLARWINDGANGPLDDAPVPLTTDHWAFQRPVAPPIPTAGSNGGANPIDAFLTAALQQRGLYAMPPLDRGRLLRRVSLDLLGLPPSAEELQAYLADTSPDAYERAVDRLLASPRYGERWARHWMDVWRYSDEDGRRDDKGQLNQIHWGSPHLWPWRDWIIHSLNDDKGYDRLLLEMLAGDELAPDDPAVLAATGFLARNKCALDRNVWLSTTVEHTAKAFLGLTLNCARCHAHKFDPISQEEYYRFRAFFEPHDIIEEPLPLDPKGGAVTVAHAKDTTLDAPTFVLERGNVTQPVKSIPITPGVPRVLGGTIAPVALPQPWPSTGRRLALARWLTDPTNPLTARVAVNHVWLRHFGRGLVETPADFGLRGKAPSNAGLLDWLAVEFQRHRWSMKWLHRLIVTSQAYCRHSATTGDVSQCVALDPENVLLWKGPSRRMESEVVRDSLLSLAGLLDARIGGPNASHTEGEASARRSLYFRTSHEDKVAFLTQFNPANLDECYQRDVGVVPQQALALVNSELGWKCAAGIAGRLPEGADDFIRAGYELVLCRPATAEEQAQCERFLREQTELLAGEEEAPVQRARTYLVHVLLNHNDFITIR
jgi:mono/diheme cytochrome c family protein